MFHIGDNKYDEWITDMNRIAPLNSYTYFQGGRLMTGQRIECRDRQEKWMEAYVIDEAPHQVFNILNLY